MTAKLDGTNGLLQQYDYQVLTTGFAYTFAAGTTVLVINPAGTLATGTITMPSAPVDGMTITFISTQQITALTINGNTGQTVVSKPALLYANQALSYVYRLSNTTWYPMVSQVASSIGPAVSAYPSTNATITAGVYTKVVLNTEDFDTSNAFDSTTNYRFTPQVAGYYQVNLVASMAQVASSNTVNSIALYKNGTGLKYGGNAWGAGQPVNNSWSGIVYLNGSTDYLEMYVYTTAANVTLTATYTQFTSCLIRGA